MKELTLGKSQNNDIIINDDTVSREAHLKIQIKDDGKIIINHHGRNDTQINHRAIQKSILKKGDTITIGDYEMPTDTLILKINNILNKSRIDFTAEYETLIKELSEYEQVKEKIQKPSQKPLLLKAVISLFILVFVYWFQEDIKSFLKIEHKSEISIIFPFMIIGGFLASYFSEKVKNKKKTRQRLDDLELKYKSRLRCPKCNADLTRKTAYYLRQHKKCINENCEATFNVRTQT